MIANQDLLVLVIIIGVFGMAFAPIIKSLLEYLVRRPRKVKIESLDIMQDIYKRRLRIAKNQKPRGLNKLTFLADEDCHGITFRRVRGFIPDTRMTEFFIKIRWYQWFPLWVIIPTRLVSNLVAGEVFVDARGLRNLGMVYGIVNNKLHASEEEQVRNEEHRYMDSILRHEEISFLQEERVNATISATSPGSNEYWVGRSELNADKSIGEEEEVE